MKSITVGFLALITACLTANLPAEPPPPVAVKFLGIFDQLRAAQAQDARGVHQNVTFRLSDSEIDEYLRYSLRATPPPGLESVTVKAFPQNYISTYTVVDFDAVERWHPGTIPTLLKPVLNGKKSIWVDYRIQARNYQVSFSVKASTRTSGSRRFL